ncbi:MAG: tetratricopeptide repeat protein [Thermoanaerobaculia bacterium]
MDPVREVTKRTARFALTATSAVFLLAACGPSSRVAPPAPEPVPALAPAPPPPPVTLDEARARRSSDPAQYDRALRSLSLSSDPATSRRAQTLLALDLFERKLYDQAVPALGTAAAANPLIAPYLQLRIIDADRSLGRTADAISTASAILTSAPSSSAATIARLELPALYAAANDEANFTLAMQQVLSIPIDELTEPEFVSLATRLAKSGRNDAATTLRMRLLRDDTAGRYTEQLYSQLSADTPSPLDALTTDEATRLASSLARSNRYDQALDLLKRISGRSDAPSSSLYRNVRLRALFNSRNYTQLLTEFSDDDLDPSLQLLRGRAAWRINKPEVFLASLSSVEKRYPGSREAVEAKVQRAKYYVTDQVDYAKSTENLAAAINAGALGNDGENLWTLGFTYVLWGHYDDALRAFERYVHDYPDGDYKTNALFWTGKIHDRLGHTTERETAFRQLIAEYPYSYYGYRARQILGDRLTSAPSEARGPRPEAPVFPDLEAELAKVQDPRLDAVRELLAVGLFREASREMKTLAAAHPDNAGIAFMLADVYANGGAVFEAINILQRRFKPFIRHGGVNIPQRLWQILFPLNYWETIRAEAQKRNLDPFLVASIIRQESGFEPTTVSNAGAVGLMQIMPAEATRIAALAGIPGLDRSRLFDPMTNIAVGAAEYSQKLAAMKGNDILAIAAYNAGEDAVGRWLAQTPVDPDPDLFIDSIPFAETRLYVKNVTRNRFEYRRVYAGSTGISQVSAPTSGAPH